MRAHVALISDEHLGWADLLADDADEDRAVLIDTDDLDEESGAGEGRRRLRATESHRQSCRRYPPNLYLDN